MEMFTRVYAHRASRDARCSNCGEELRSSTRNLKARREFCRCFDYRGSDLIPSPAPPLHEYRTRCFPWHASFPAASRESREPRCGSRIKMEESASAHGSMHERRACPRRRLKSPNFYGGLSSRAARCPATLSASFANSRRSLLSDKMASLKRADGRLEGVRFFRARASPFIGHFYRLAAWHSWDILILSRESKTSISKEAREREREMCATEDDGLLRQRSTKRRE